MSRLPAGLRERAMRRRVILYDTTKDTWLDGEQGRWMLFCLRHETLMYFDSRDLARGFKRVPEQWCEGCFDEAG